MDGCGTYLNVDGEGDVKVLEASQRPAFGGLLTESGLLPKELMGMSPSGKKSELAGL